MRQSESVRFYHSQSDRRTRSSVIQDFIEFTQAIKQLSRLFIDAIPNFKVI